MQIYHDLQSIFSNFENQTKLSALKLKADKTGIIQYTDASE